MPFQLTIQPQRDILVSTLIPIFYQCRDTDPNTTNVIAKCYVTNQTTSVSTQVGGSYRLAPNLEFAGYFKFDASEVFNTLTKWTLENDSNAQFGSNVGMPASIRSGADVVNFRVYVEFYREYLDTTTGLIVIDPTPLTSYATYVHEGSPDKNFLTQVVNDNGTNVGAFKYFNTLNDIENKVSRWFTNYPIKLIDGKLISKVTIRRDETYSLRFHPPPSQQNDVCGYYISLKTYDESMILLNTHTTNITDDFNTQSIRCGMFDVVNGYTANLAEGTNFENVTNYTINFIANTGGATCVAKNVLTQYNFKINDTCNKNTGYLRFAFKNMLGGFDLVTSNGKYSRKTKNKFEDFEQSLGYFGMFKPMEFGNSNWANQNVERYSVTTHVMKKENAIHFAEMFSSTNVYLRVENNGHLSVVDTDLNLNALEQPIYYEPIILKGKTINIEKSNDNYASLKFTFEMAVNQRNPRY